MIRLYVRVPIMLCAQRNSNLPPLVLGGRVGDPATASASKMATYAKCYISASFYQIKFRLNLSLNYVFLC